MTDTVRHPIFARMYNRSTAQWEKKGQDEHRRELLAGLSGRVLEVGAGDGINFKYYPPEVSEVIAVEPEPYMRSEAERAAASSPVPVRVVDGLAERLPAEDGSVDAAVACLMLCSVADPEASLRELRRVIRPGGELRFYEHVVARNPRLRRIQHAIAPVWPHITGGCQPDRDTVGAIERAGLDIERARHFPYRPEAFVAAIAPHVIGVARKPA